MNPKSGLVSPQFHLVFDDNFEAVPHIWAGNVPENCSKLVDSPKEKSLKGFYYVTKTCFEGKVDPSADPHSSANHKTSFSSTSQLNSSRKKIRRIVISHFFG